MNKIRIIYAGYHIETLLILLGESRFDVAAAGLINVEIRDILLPPLPPLLDGDF